MKNKEKGIKQEVEEEEISRLFVGIMEGYKDSAIPPLSDFSPMKNQLAIYQKVSSSIKRERIEPAETENIQKERERRGKMAENFSILQSMVPSVSHMPKATREKIVTETICYIKNLEEEAKRLEGLKKSLLQQEMKGKSVLSHCTSWKPSVTASFSNGFAFLGIELLVEQGLLSKIFKVFEVYQAEVLVATILLNDHGVLNLTVKIKLCSGGGDIVEMMKTEILRL